MKKNKLSAFAETFVGLKNKVFAGLYFAQAVSLLGDAVTWVGLALLSYQFGKEKSAIILASALTLRVTAFIIFFALCRRTRRPRKPEDDIGDHTLYPHGYRGLPALLRQRRMADLCLGIWLNVFNAFFTPTYRAVIPQVVDKAHYRQAVGLSKATFQILGVLGPGLAGILAVWFGARDIFFIDAASFIVAGILILPADKLQKKADKTQKTFTAWQDVLKGIKLLFANPIIRFALIIEFISAIAGAQILVNSVGHVKNALNLDDKHYGWVMAAFGIGASIAAFVVVV